MCYLNKRVKTLLVFSCCAVICVWCIMISLVSSVYKSNGNEMHCLVFKITSLPVHMILPRIPLYDGHDGSKEVCYHHKLCILCANTAER